MIHGPLLVALLLQLQTAPPAPPAWMAGCWVRALPEGTVEEHWMARAGGTMIGMGRTVRGGRTTNYEFTRIAVVDGRLSFVANPSGQAPATLPMKSMTADEVVFENLAHDFPQRVIYRRAGTAGLNARVEGQTSRGPIAEDFAYRRC